LLSWSLLPVQTTWTGVDIVTTSDEYVAYVDNTNIVTWTWSELAKIWSRLENFISCKKIIDKYWSWINDWVYKINPSWKDLFEVYCDMTMDWGGWTLVANFDKNFSDYSSNTVWEVYKLNTSWTKLSDNLINALGWEHFMFEWLKATDYSYKEYLYCSSFDFDYSWIAKASWKATCSRTFDENYVWYGSSWIYHLNWYVISHWNARDVWIRNNSNWWTRWEFNNWNEWWYSFNWDEVAYNQVDIRMWVK